MLPRCQVGDAPGRVEPRVSNEGKLRRVDGSLAGRWIRSRLGGEFGSVTTCVPKGFAAYARIFHPASDLELSPLRWSAVAERNGKSAHRAMQWRAIANDSHPVEDPSLGELDPVEFGVLAEFLALHTSDLECCFFGLSDIWAWVPKVVAINRRMPRLKLPLERNYVVLRGPLTAIGEITDGVTAHSPGLCWPADHSWLVASDVDFDSTLVGGSHELIHAIVDSPKLEAWRVEPSDSLAADGDKVNELQP